MYFIIDMKKIFILKIKQPFSKIAFYLRLESFNAKRK